METKEEKEARKKITRRLALKRIALAAGGIGVMGSLHSWGHTEFGDGSVDVNQSERGQVAAYYSYKIYSSGYPSMLYSSTYSSYYSSMAYSSIAPPPSSRRGGCTRSD